jgi:hypothetical protein
MRPGGRVLLTIGDIQTELILMGERRPVSVGEEDSRYRHPEVTQPHREGPRSSVGERATVAPAECSAFIGRT